MDKFEPKFIFGKASYLEGRIKFTLDRHEIRQLSMPSDPVDFVYEYHRYYSAKRADIKKAIQEARKLPSGALFSYELVDKPAVGSDKIRESYGYAIFHDEKLHLGCMVFSRKNLETLLEWARSNNG